MKTPRSSPPDPPAPNRGSLVPILLAILFFSLVSLVLIFLTLGSFGLILLAAGGLFLVAGLHYLVWGWWLGRVIREEESDEENEP
jgi:drug/metabolite transporter superfamily protein YnfA